jgi:hypothetical protein
VVLPHVKLSGIFIRRPVFIVNLINQKITGKGKGSIAVYRVRYDFLNIQRHGNLTAKNKGQKNGNPQHCSLKSHLSLHFEKLAGIPKRSLKMSF